MAYIQCGMCQYNSYSQLQKSDCGLLWMFAEK